MSPGLWVAVAAVGGLGAVARFLIDGAVRRRIPGPFPSGTFVINLSGAFGLGLLTGLSLSPDALLIAGTATIGAYTTFSTWMLDSQRLAESGARRAAALNLAGSLLLGFGAALLGRFIAGLL